MIFLRIKAAVKAVTIPIPYSPIKAIPCCSKPHTRPCGTAKPMRITYTGIRAEQLMNGVTIMVISLSFQLLILRVLMIAGMAQAPPETSATILRPLSPTLRIETSNMLTALDIYPISSSIPRNKKRIAICGMKTSIPVSPASNPSQIKSVAHPIGKTDRMIKPTWPMVASIKSIGPVAQANMAWKINNINRKKNITPNTGCITQRSILSVIFIPAPPSSRCKAFRMTGVNRSYLDSVSLI